jgi:hypothetical protein
MGPVRSASIQSPRVDSAAKLWVGSAANMAPMKARFRKRVRRMKRSERVR